MKVLHVTVEQGDGWLVAQGLESPGVITQGRNFDELIANIRDAAELLLQEKNIHIELLLPSGVTPATKPATRAHRSRKSGSARRRVA
ncbi:MAG TPA: hypothetical protein VGM03_16875 [Phycisphaerae bacterium]|jgi:predicted RNase H-like HicB family nuclease